MPNGSEENFTDAWKAWIKATGAKLKKKGKGLFHPIRYAARAILPHIGKS